MRTLLLWISIALILFGLLLLGPFPAFAAALMALGLLLLIVTLLAREPEDYRWRALAEFDRDRRDRIIGVAQKFGALVDVESVIYPRVAASHTRIVNVLGVDGDGERVVVGVEPSTAEVVKMVRLCPRKGEEATETVISRDEAESCCRSFLDAKGLSLPENYVADEARVVSLGPWKRWRFVWRHVKQGVRLLPDFVTMEVNASEDTSVISYSRVDHKFEVDLTPGVQLREAVDRAKKAMPELGDLELAKDTLAVTYPNRFFEDQTWKWSDSQALCWILEFQRDGKHTIDVWVDATTGEVVGGAICHLHSPEVFGIDAVGDAHMQSHLTNVWSPALELMKFDVSSLDWTNTAAGFTEATISNAIATGRYFVVEGHGDVTPTAEMMCIAYQGTADVQAFTPDEVPANNLRFVLLDTCQSGEDGTGLDFKDTFISQGADVFIGFDEYMCAWDYEERLLHYLSLGLHLANAHNLADSDVSPWYPIVITYDVACLNKVRLAPLLVTVSRSPAGDVAKGSSFTVTTSINNREDVDHTAAANVQAQLIVPASFSITSGANPQNVGTVNWDTPATASWTVTSPNSTGSYKLDVEVWSDNLGTAVDDPSDPFHKFDVGVVGHFDVLLQTIYVLLSKWFWRREGTVKLRR